MPELIDWITSIDINNAVLYIKRLSANDTLASNAHQAGPYIQKDILFHIFPELNQRDQENPRINFNLYIPSHASEREVTAIWYNNKFRGGTRNEARITNFGGKSSVLLDPESTGALTIFYFDLSLQTPDCYVWVCRNELEEDIIEERFGIIEPGKPYIYSPKQNQSFFDPPKKVSCWLEPTEIPKNWLSKFPSTQEIFDLVLQRCSKTGLNPDELLIKRRECEFEMFRSLELAIELPIIHTGFQDMESFLNKAQTILQRRKARSGKSLELHVRQILTDEGLSEGKDFSYQPESETNKRPDFIFPSEACYKDNTFDARNLRMLAVKTSCKDRWRQIINEADRIPVKHLFTLQEGVSENQLNEMQSAGVRLVVPKSIIKKYPSNLQTRIQDFESFIGDLRLLHL
ncbi:type II restriction endonuclease [Herpetosiphon llansteffanensis]